MACKRLAVYALHVASQVSQSRSFLLPILRRHRRWHVSRDDACRWCNSGGKGLGHHPSITSAGGGIHEGDLLMEFERVHQCQLLRDGCENLKSWDVIHGRSLQRSECHLPCHWMFSRLRPISRLNPSSLLKLHIVTHITAYLCFCCLIGVNEQTLLHSPR